MLEVLSYTSLEGSFTEAIPTTAILMHGAVFSRQLAIDTRLIVRTKTQSTILQLRDIGEVITIDINHSTGGVLSEDHRSGTTVFRDQRSIEGGRRHH